MSLLYYRGYDMTKYSKILFGGRSMIEMLGVIAIGGVMTAATLQLYSYANRKSKAIQMENIINNTAEDINTLLLGRNWSNMPFDGNGKKYFEKKKIKLVDAWGKEFAVERTSTSTDGRFFINITVNSIADCITLAKRISALKIKVNDMNSFSGCKNKDNKMEFYFR